MPEEKRWIIVGNSSPYTYVGKTDMDACELEHYQNHGKSMLLHDARQIQTIVIPAGNQIGQENLVGPISLCAGGTTISITPTMTIEPDEKTIAIIKEKIGMAHTAAIHDSAKRAGLETDVSNVHSINKDGLKGKP